MDVYQWLILALVTGIAVTTAFHALLYKRDPRSAFAWVAICLLFPLAGPALYAFFGINRIRMRARKLQQERAFQIELDRDRSASLKPFAVSSQGFPDDYVNIRRVADAVTRRPLVSGNRVTPLVNGENAYPDMLEAIASAEHSVFLSSYIFQCDTSGLMFVDALADCVRRGVDVRVIIDGVGELYGLPRRVGKLLASCGIRVARFLPPRLLPPTLYINLRNHRKMLIVDGRVGYTGGMNISDRHLVEQPEPPSRASDIHFRISGPVVTQLEHAFLEDWYFCTGDEQMPQTPFDWSKQPASELGSAMCRAISEGPNEDFNKLGTILIGAISSARQRVIIVTPYFLPSREMIGALQSAALRGARVTVLLPEKSNLPYIHWATRNMLWEMLQFGVHTYYQPAPFAHTKLFIVDDFYAHIGSANIDARSLRLNFELNVEIFDREVVRQLAGYAETTKARSRIITSDELEGRSLPVRTRDALVWLFYPYL